jgi:hypothetical protein
VGKARFLYCPRVPSPDPVLILAPYALAIIGLYVGWRYLEISGRIKPGRKKYFLASGSPADVLAHITTSLRLHPSAEFEISRLDTARARLVLHDLDLGEFWYPVWLSDQGEGQTLVRVGMTSFLPFLVFHNHDRCVSFLKSILWHA